MLEDYIAEHNLCNSVTLLGFQDNPYSYMKASDLFVCSSYVEGYSTVLVEALICGTPVLSTKCSGANEILGDSEYGLLVENDENALYHGIKSLLNSPQMLQMFAEKAVKRGKTFSIESKIREICGLFEYKNS